MKRLNEIFSKGEVLLNVTYDSFNKELVLLCKHPETNVKNLYSLKDPYIPIYIAEKEPKHHLDYIEKNKVKQVYVRESFREWNIANALGYKNFGRLVKEGIIDKDQIYLNKRLFAADTHIEDMVIKEYVKYYAKLDGERFVTNFPMINNFHIGVFDIESDIKKEKDEYGSYPINMISYIDGKDYTCYSVFVKNDEYAGQKELIENLEEFKVYMKNFLIEYLDNIDINEMDKEKKEIKTKMIKETFKPLLEKITFEIKVFDTEKEMLENFYPYIFNEKVPDFLMAYNTKYDMGQTVNRCKTLGIPFDDLIKYRDYNSSHIFAINNDSNKPIKRFHNYYTRNMTKILDYYLIYYQMRRASTFSKMSLDATAKREIGVGKLDYSKTCNWIGDFPYKDFKLFLMYNIIDNIALLLTERNTNDVYGAVYTRFDVSTEWFRTFRPMVSVTNVFDNIPEMNGYIPGCNTNRVLLKLSAKHLKKVKEVDEGLYNVGKMLKSAVKDKDEDDYEFKVEGGYVSNPNNLSDKIRTKSVYKLSPKNYFRIEDCADSDAKEMYPSDIRVNNSSKGTLLGVVKKIGDNQNDDIGHIVSLSLINKNYSSIGHNIFNLPTPEDLVKEYYGIERKIYDRYPELGKFNNEEEVILNISDKNVYNDIKKFWRILYTTKYDEIDIEAGRPSINKVIISSDKNHLEFQYFDTKVELTINKDSFNKILGIHGKGFIFGELFSSKEKIRNLNEEYIDFVKPKPLNEEDILDRVYYGKLSEDEYNNLMNAKIQPVTLTFGELELTTLKFPIFWDKTVCDNFYYEVYSTKDNNEYLLILNSKFKSDNFEIDIKQSIIVYNEIK